MTLGIAAAMVLIAIIAGVVGSRSRVANPQEYLVGGRSFGTILLWLLSAGEIYTTFTFLGAAGWAYGKGAPAFYILCYGPVAYVIGYFAMPLVWKVAKRFDLLTIGDLFAQRYQSKLLGAFVAIVGFAFLIPYVTLQLTGLQVLLGIAGYGAIDSQTAVFVAVLVMAVFAFATGLRGTAWTSVFKDAFVLAGVIFAGILLPVHFFGSPAAVIARVEAAHPGWLTLAASGSTYSASWFVSTVILTGVTFFLWPQSIAAIYSAKSANALRRNYVFLPLYQIMLVLMMFAGLTALLVVPGLVGPDADKSFVLVVQKFYPPWVLGAVAGAGALAALVPVSAQLLAAAGLVARNVFEELFAWKASEAQRTAVMRGLVLVLAAGALILWANFRATLVELLLIGYNGIAQFIPGVATAFAWRRATAWGVGAGIAAGLIVLGIFAKDPTLYGINTGLIALAVNAAVAVLVSLATSPPPDEIVDRFRVAALAENSSS